MLDKGTDFPQYRKLSNDKVFYRIVDERHFDEIQIIGYLFIVYLFAFSGCLFIRQQSLVSTRKLI